MAVDRDERAMEQNLRRIFQSYGIKATDIDGVPFVGLCSTRQVGDKGGAYVPSTPTAIVVALPTLAKDILEALR